LRLFSCEHSYRSLEGYREYQAALRRYNARLKKLGQETGNERIDVSHPIPFVIPGPRRLKNTGAPVEMISELLGHKSIKDDSDLSFRL
jgi:hypothetical protein